MNRTIKDVDRDEAHWTLELSCGHIVHVASADPSMVGYSYDCPKCDRR